LSNLDTVLKINNLYVGLKDMTIVKDFSLDIHKREIIGIVGESGCGKSTMLKSIVGLSDNNVSIQKGKIDFHGVSLRSMDQNQLRSIRGNKISFIFQKPDYTFDPVMKVKSQFFETVKFHTDGKANKKDCYKRSRELLEQLHFEAPDEVLESYPFELSGGMNQRIAVAMSMINEPELILADEPTSALDVSVQSQVVRTLMELRDKTGVAILMVSHNINVIASMADMVGVMYGGRMVEYGDAREVLQKSRHPYTKALLDAVPAMSQTMPESIEGAPPRFSEILQGCPFRERCPFSENKCETEPAIQGDASHWWLCHKQ